MRNFGGLRVMRVFETYEGYEDFLGLWVLRELRGFSEGYDSMRVYESYESFFLEL